MRHPSISLIIGTLGPASYLGRLLESIVEQEVEVEVLVVDQNLGNHVERGISPFRDRLNIRHLRSAPGLSRARNLALRHASGRIIAFPDDDCWYPKNLISSILEILDDTQDFSGVTCRCADLDGRLAAGAEDKRPGFVTKREVWGRGVSATLFIRRQLYDEIGGFDERLGLGSGTDFQSSEETDFLLRAIAAGHQIAYRPHLTVHHPSPSRSGQNVDLYKVWSYGLGAGRVLRLHRYSIPTAIRHVMQPLAGACVSVAQGRPEMAKIRFVRAVGRFQGWLHPMRLKQKRPVLVPRRADSATASRS